MKKDKKPSFLFKIFKRCLTFFYLKIKIEGVENLPDEPCIIVANHAQMHGPLACELYLDDSYYCWCAGQMMSLKDVPSYAYEDFWSYKPKAVRPFYKILSYIIAPLCVFVFNNARTVGVYHDMRILKTFRKSLKLLEDGKNIVIFPEHYKEHNNIVYDFREKFVDIADIYHKKTGKELSFVPLYVAPCLRTIYFGKPVRAMSDKNKEEQRKYIKTQMMDAITEIATSLPLHTVTPYANLPKKQYPKNKEEGEK